MTKKRQFVFSLVRGALAIFIALLVAAVLIFISADGETLADKFALTGNALKQLLMVRCSKRTPPGRSAHSSSNV